MSNGGADYNHSPQTVDAINRLKLALIIYYLISFTIAAALSWAVFSGEFAHLFNAINNWVPGR